MEKQLSTFYFRSMLNTHLRNKSGMAGKLGLDIRRVQRLFRTLDGAKGGTIVLDKLLYFCVSDGIPIDPIIHQFMEREGVKTENITGGLLSLAEINPDIGVLLHLHMPVPIFCGTGGGCLEAPHIYRIGDWYFLLTAEGGTNFTRMATASRSHTLYGPYEACPLNQERKDPHPQGCVAFPAKKLSP